ASRDPADGAAARHGFTDRSARARATATETEGESTTVAECNASEETSKNAVIQCALSDAPPARSTRDRRRVRATRASVVSRTLESLRASVPRARLIGDPSTPVADLRYDSREVRPGTLFFCIPG